VETNYYSMPMTTTTNDVRQNLSHALFFTKDEKDTQSRCSLFSRISPYQSLNHLLSELAPLGILLKMSLKSFLWTSFLLAVVGSVAIAWSPPPSSSVVNRQSVPTKATIDNPNESAAADQPMNRRQLFQQSAIIAATAASALISNPQPSLASATSPSTLPEFLYRILRVKEATQQEIRLIGTGKFKDVQRANVKLAVKFMIKNYKLSDCLLGAALYLPSSKQQAAVQVGQSAVQSLQTILEYFDSSDVQNIKVCGYIHSYDDALFCLRSGLG
jgi:hypothetical protein